MIRQMKKKLKSQSGASLMFALLFFVMCGVIGSIVLTSGSGVSGQLATVREDDQEYYAVSSAAQYVKTCINGSEFTITEKKTETIGGADSYEFGGIKEKTDSAVAEETILSKLLSDCFETYLSKSDSERWNADLTANGTALTDAMSYSVRIQNHDEMTCVLHFSIDASGNLKVTVQQPDGDFKLILEGDADISEIEETELVSETNTYETTKTITVAYHRFRIRKG